MREEGARTHRQPALVGAPVSDQISLVRDYTTELVLFNAQGLIKYEEFLR
jgi:hypothetical protein